MQQSGRIEADHSAQVARSGVPVHESRHALEIDDYQLSAALSRPETTKILDRGSISIGRAAQNDWVLQDPERILSSKHCAVHHQDGGYFLTDTSTNGVYLNDSDQRLMPEPESPSKDGDRFVLGEYEIAATLLPAAGSED